MLEIREYNIPIALGHRTKVGIVIDVSPTMFKTENGWFYIEEYRPVAWYYNNTLCAPNVEAEDIVLDNVELANTWFGQVWVLKWEKEDIERIYKNFTHI